MTSIPLSSRKERRDKDAKQVVLRVRPDAYAHDVFNDPTRIEPLWWICTTTPDPTCTSCPPGECCYPETIGGGGSESEAWTDAAANIEALEALD